MIRLATLEAVFTSLPYCTTNMESEKTYMESEKVDMEGFGARLTPYFEKVESIKITGKVNFSSRKYNYQ